MRKGEVYDARVALCYPPAALTWTLAVNPPEVAEGRATVAPGENAITLRIVAKGNGIARITYTVPNFGRAPSTRDIGEVRVTDSTRRRAARN